MDNPFAQEPKATAGWLWQVITGVGLVFLLGLHIIANHFIAKGGLRNFADVLAYLRNPVFLVLEVLFLVVVASRDARHPGDPAGFRAVCAGGEALEPDADHRRGSDSWLRLVADVGHRPLNLRNIQPQHIFHARQERGFTPIDFVRYRLCFVCERFAPFCDTDVMSKGYAGRA